VYHRAQALRRAAASSFGVSPDFQAGCGPNSPFKVREPLRACFLRARTRPTAPSQLLVRQHPLGPAKRARRWDADRLAGRQHIAERWISSFHPPIEAQNRAAKGAPGAASLDPPAAQALATAGGLQLGNVHIAIHLIEAGTRTPLRASTGSPLTRPSAASQRHLVRGRQGLEARARMRWRASAGQ